MPHRAEQPDSVDRARPEWFAAFLADRGTRKPSAHTLKAYRQDFDAIAALIAGGEDLSSMALDAITIHTLRTAFARYEWRKSWNRRSFRPAAARALYQWRCSVDGCR